MQGAKAVRETLASDYTVRLLCGTDAFLHATDNTSRAREVCETSEKELTALGSVETNASALAVVEMKPTRKPLLVPDKFTLVLDDIRDPGNLGTIIRTADWFGIKTILASPETTDLFSPKVINATMGSFLRVDVHYVALEEILSAAGLRIFGTFLDGDDVHTINFGKGGFVVIGNESRGISAGVEKLVSARITIPRLGLAESLNASVATAIVLDNIFRRS